MSSQHNEPRESAERLDEDIRQYHRVRSFYVEEARLLDDRAFDAWLDLLADDIRYRIPVRSTTAEGGRAEFQDLCHMDANKWRLEKRIQRLDTEHAWAERPHTRTRHHVSNISIREAAGDELDVTSNLLVYLNRGDSADHDLFSGERVDRLRDGEDGLVVAERTVYLDQATLPVDKLSVFL